MTHISKCGTKLQLCTGLAFSYSDSKMFKFGVSTTKQGQKMSCFNRIRNRWREEIKIN